MKHTVIESGEGFAVACLDGIVYDDFRSEACAKACAKIESRPTPPPTWNDMRRELEKKGFTKSDWDLNIAG